MTTQVAADLRAAADVLRRDGWMQHDNGSCDGPKCAAGAVIFTVTGGVSTYEIPDTDAGEEMDQRAYDAMRVLAHALGEPAGLHVPRFNDAEGRTADEVIAALQAAADAAEQQA